MNNYSQATTLSQSAPTITVRSELILRFGSLVFGLGLAVLLIQQYRIENRTFFYVAALAGAGFAVHALLPLSYRLLFFVSLSFAGFALAFTIPDAAWLLGIGLSLIALCHLPVRFWVRVALIIVVGIALSLARAQVFPTPVGGAVWPILGSIFMFRLALYLHAIKHREVDPNFARTLAYFFMLPNVTFALFPVIDYATFRRNYYDEDAWSIYETGLRWIVRGLVQLLLYRLIYLNFSLQATEVHRLGDLVQYVVTTFLLYLRVSGQFHLVVGLLHLFGFRLPETHHLYYLSASFTDFWRRINIYWKDFMMKLVYYPSFFGLRRFGNRRAIVLATATVFVVTWLLHSYQWFWLRGGFPITVPDTLFWGILGVSMVLASLSESERGRRRVGGKARWSLQLGLKTVAMFCVLAVLWSLWSTESVVEWIWMWRTAGVASARELATFAALVVVGVAVTGWPWGAQTLRANARVPLYRNPTLRAVATLLTLLVLTVPAVQQALPASARRLVASLQDPGLNSADAALRVRGYYEQLDQRGALNGQALWQEVAQKPSSWTELSTENVLHARSDFLITDLKPSYHFVWNGHSTSTNRWGMRDRDYTLEKPAGTFRIAILGPSLVMGNGVDDSEVFDNVLEDRLAREPIATGTRTEVLNFGVNGYALPQQVALLEDRVLRFHPDVVFITESPYFRDGIGRFLQRAIWEGTPVPYPELQQLLSKKGLYPLDTTGVAIPFASLRRIAGVFGVDSRMTWGESRSRIQSVSLEVAEWATRRMTADIRAGGAVPVLLAISPADPLPRDPEALLRIADSGVLAFDLLHLYDGQELTAIRVAPWDNHPNAIGHRMIADGLYHQLRQNAASLHLRAAAVPSP
jgi:D-alanyl-lipoteichoic acid acyltransferase DltB (MBOAT superfamily)